MALYVGHTQYGSRRSILARYCLTTAIMCAGVRLLATDAGVTQPAGSARITEGQPDPSPAVLGALIMNEGGVIHRAAPHAREERTTRLPRVLLRTERGDIELEIDTGRAPITSSNFLRYVDGRFFDGGRFFRTVRADNQPLDSIRIAVVQAGIDPARAQEQFPPIALEPTSVTGLRHREGTVSMARAAPNSATSSFFITLADEPALDSGGRRNPDGLGFAAFARVVRGMDVVRAIHAAPADERQLLLEPVRILSAHRIER